MGGLAALMQGPMTAAMGRCQSGALSGLAESILGPLLDQEGDFVGGASMGACPNYDVAIKIPDAADEQVCTQILMSGGSKKFEEQIEKAEQAAACKSGKLRQAAQDLSCIQEMGDAMNQGMTATQAMFAQTLTQAGEAVKKIEIAIEDAKQKEDQLKKIINGDPESGRPGLIEMEQKNEEMKNQILADLRMIKQRHEEAVRYEAQYARAKEVAIMSKAIQCFKSTPALVKSADGKSLSASKCYLTEEVAAMLGLPTGLQKGGCSPYVMFINRAYKEGFISHGKVKNMSNRSKNQAREGSVNPAAAFQVMFDKAPKEGTTLPTNLEELKKQTLTHGGFLDPKDLAKFAPNLASVKFTSKSGQPVTGLDFVQPYLNYCYNQAKKDFKVQDGPGSQGEIIRQEIDRFRKDTQLMASTAMNKYKEHYIKMARAMGAPQNLPFETGCIGEQKPEIHNACINRAKEIITNMYQPQISIDPNNPPKQLGYAMGRIRLTGGNGDVSQACYGLRHCIEVSQGMLKVAQGNVHKGEAQKKATVSQANSQVQAMRQQMKKYYQGINQQIVARMGSVNKLLQQVPGVNRSVGFPLIEGEEFQAGDDPGLFEIPTDTRKLIGGGLQDVSNESMKEAFESIREPANEIDQRFAELAQAKKQVKVTEQACRSKKMEKIMDAALAQVQDLSANNCDTKVPDHCDRQDALAAFKAVLRNVSSSDAAGLDETSLSSLENGVDRAWCRTNLPQAGSGMQGEMPKSSICEGIITDLTNKLQKVKSTADKMEKAAAAADE